MIGRSDRECRFGIRKCYTPEGLISGWILLALMVNSGGTSAANSLDRSTSTLTYLSTQAEAVVHYLKLMVLPWPLILDYEWPLAGLGDAWLEGLVIIALLITTAGLVATRRPAGYPAAWFFICLAPTSSFLPMRFPVVEYRMYLALAGPVVLCIGGFAWAGRLLADRLWAGTGRPSVRPGLLALVLLAGALAAATVFRNLDYQDHLTIWRDTVLKQPHNPRAQNNLGALLSNAGHPRDALPHLLEAVRLSRGYFDANLNLGLTLGKLKRFRLAAGYLEKALEISPDDQRAMISLGRYLIETGEYDRAVAVLDRLVVARPDYAPGLYLLGLAWERAGHPEKAQHYYLLRSRLLLNLPPKAP